MDGFILPRQACRCGHVFGSLQAHKAHAALAEPLPHDHPASVGLVELDGEWVIKTVSAPAPVAKTEAANPDGSYPFAGNDKRPTPVRGADKPSTRGTRECKLPECSETFDLPNRRGRPPVYCLTHRK